MTAPRIAAGPVGLALGVLVFAWVAPARAEAPCGERLAACAAGCRAGTFIGDPARGACLAGCGEGERACRRAAACAPGGACPPDPAPARRDSRLQP
ncbi:hypothetical protein [Methylobacterium oryzihabitans]|uniref:Uncharacterized protein n=1 Tax=Methylobacterium oryzihabitans TaxID=2499852 RepID=A0A437P125_9HYPH|nr:hypothetical protein [Methylobacterium oryzihabitans]RVU15962.1 hypothetical protein EOE48_18025 [Methylobacterium oryzihabitans]